MSVRTSTSNALFLLFRVLIACAISVVWFQFASPVYDFTFLLQRTKCDTKCDAFMCVRFVRSLKVAGLHIPSRRKTTPNLSQLYTHERMRAAVARRLLSITVSPSMIQIGGSERVALFMPLIRQFIGVI